MEIANHPQKPELVRYLRERGIAAIILKYRLAREEGSTYSIEEHSLADAQRAIRLVRSRANEWHIDPARIGIMGFSAGGELAALASRKFDEGSPTAPDPIDRVGSKPAFQALIYPGNSKSIAPDKDSPPAFLACGFDDRPDISEGLANVLALRGNESVRNLVFLIGGAYGLDEAVLRRAKFKWSLSELTFPHQLVRLILAEQLYRACSILRNEKYHHR